jgi:hypothetical protein
MKHTLATEKNGKVPELSHVESLENLTLVGSTITVQNDTGSLLLVVLLGKSKTGTNGDLGTDDTVTTVEVGGEHVHGTTLSVGDTLAAAEQLSDDRADGTTTHQSETVASVGCDNLVVAADGVFDTGGDGFLADRQMAETSDLLLLVQTIGGHFHASGIGY